MKPIAPLVIFPTSAKKEENYKLDPKAIVQFHQVEGQYGYPGKNWFDCSFAVSSKGSITTEIFDKFINEKFTELLPDLSDTAGKRAITKVDSGPGRFGQDVLPRSKVDGHYLFPGVPNGTELGQEMDQLFAAFKACAYNNRDKLYKAKGDSVRPIDFGYCVFGGKVQVSEGDPEEGTEPEYLELENAFTKYLSPEHIAAAREKCGYCPATRNGRRNRRIRHEVVEGGNDLEEDEYVDEITEILEELCKENGLRAKGSKDDFIKSLTEHYHSAVFKEN